MKFDKIAKNYILPVLAISALSTIVMYFLFTSGRLDSLELKTLDMRFVLRGERKFHDKDAADRVKVIAIDAKTVQEVGRWPWPRGVVAKLVSGVCGEAPAADASADEGWEDVESADSGWEDIPDSGAGAKEPATEEKTKTDKNAKTEPVKEIGKQRALGIDVLFDRTERPYSKYLFRNGSMMDPLEQDKMAVEALGACQSVVYVSLLKFTEGKNLKATDLGLGDEAKAYMTDDGTVIYNTPLKQYQLANTRTGFANMEPSIFDERVRRARLYYKLGDRYVHSFALTSLASFLGVDDKDIKIEKNKVIVGKYTIPTNDDGTIYINYRGKEYKAGKDGVLIKENVISALDVIQNPDLIPLLMQGNYIFLIGVTDPELRDIFYTPFSIAKQAYPANAVVSGVEIHKEIIDTILQGDYLKDAPRWTLIVMLIVASAIVILCTLLRLWAGVISVFAVGGAHVFFALSSFKSTGTIYPIIAVLLSLPLCFALSMLYRNFVVDREKNAVKNIFKSYVAPHVLAELMENPSDLKLGGKKSKVSVLFSDIRGFTTISEQTAPQVLIKGLNHYLSNMTKLVLDNKGMIDKFIGDAVMAIWGAPVPRDEDAANAVRSALLMEGTLKQINPAITEMIGQPFAIGVGINTGEAVLGNIGSEGKLDYTVIGDTVNLASRLEGLTKQYGAFLVISENTYAEIKDQFDCRLLDLVKVKGKDKPVAIYQVFCEKGKLDDTRLKMIERYNNGLEHYRAKRFGEAKTEFNAAAAIIDCKTCAMYVERCDHYTENPPPEDWDGSFAWKTK